MKALRIISLLSYFLILLKGSMIALPFIFWLIFTCFDFRNIDQLFALFAITGIIANFTKWKDNNIVMLISFLLMLSPIVSRMSQVDIELFDYMGFQIPLLIFVVTYLVLIYLTTVNCIKRNIGIYH